MDRRLVRVVVWLVFLGFVANQVPSSGEDRSESIHLRTGNNKGQARAKQAGKLAKKLVGALPGILKQFEARRRKLADAGYPRAGVATLLDSTEASLQKEFKKRDFAPLRDHIAEVFDKARSDLGLPTRTALRSTPAPQAILASLHLTLAAAVPDSLDPSQTDSVLGWVKSFLEDLKERATRNDLIVDLCVLSNPPKAKVALHMASGREIEPTKTNGRLTKLFRGNYFYTVEKRSSPKIDCGSSKPCLKLYDKKQPVLSCDWDGGGGECLVQDGWPEACRGR